MTITWANALSWRLKRHFLTQPAGNAVEVVDRLGAVSAWSGDPRLAISTRVGRDVGADIDSAVADGSIVKTYLYGGSSYLASPAHAAAALTLRAAGKQWELPSWREHYNLAPTDWPALTEVVNDALVTGPLTQLELAAAVGKTRQFRHLEAAIADKSHTLLKPLAWQGVMSFGPSRDGVLTFQRLADNEHWPGIPDLDDAGKQAMTSYLATYGPTTIDRLHYRLTEGLSAGRKRVERWAAELIDDSVTRLDIDGVDALALGDDADAIAAEEAPLSLVMVPGFDPWVLGAGTADPRIVPPEHRALATKGAGLVLSGGVMHGVWKRRKATLEVTWLASTPAPKGELERAAEQLAVHAGLEALDLHVG